MKNGKLRRILAGGAIAVFGAWIILSLVTNHTYDFRPADGFIFPPPRPIENLGGPAGAMVSRLLLDSLGYLAVIVPILLLLWGISRLFSIPGRKTVVITGELIAGHGILAALLALPGGTLASSLTGKFGANLAGTMKSVFGSVGAYFVGIAIFIVFIVAITRLDTRSTFKAAIRGISGANAALAARRKRRESRKAASREELIAKYDDKTEEQRYSGITGSIIPGEQNATETEPEEPPEIPIERASTEAQHDGNAARMEYSFSPKIIRSMKHSCESADTAKKSPPPPPPATAGPIDPKEILREKKSHDITEPHPDKQIPVVDVAHDDNTELETEIVQRVRQALTDDDNSLTIAHEEPLPDPILQDKSEDEAFAEEKIIATYEKNAIIKPKAGPVDRKPERPKGPYRWQTPHYDILTEQEKVDTNLSDSVLQERAKHLLETLRSFKVDGNIHNICPGPVITRYELEPAVGVKVSRIANLADDIALALKAQDIRIVAPIPGKGAVGIEVPNEVTEIVRIKELLKSPDFRETKHSLPMALGKRVDGSPAVVDLTKMPHLLIAGATGSGKSVCINTIITSLVYSKSPEDLRFIMIDPKRLELSVYSDIPHLTAPIVVEPKNAAIALNWAVEEMDARYKKLSLVGVRSIAAYNEHAISREEEGVEKLPYVVVLIDELADLMVAVSTEIEEPIARLAQMARAVGIHLVIATQRPSVDVITGLIKANFPSRMAFKVRSKIDSRTILDMGGAERLLGYGDMLYLPSGFAEPIRIHGSLITTEETEKVVKHLRTFPNPYPDRMLDFEEAATTLAISQDRDELFWEAAKIVVIYQQGSTSFLQRKLRVGYTRAGCIIDQLELAGIVGSFQGSKARDVLLDNLDALEEMQAGGSAE